MPSIATSPFKPLTKVMSKYVTSHKARVEAQKQAKGTASGPTGAEVDAHVASTLTKKQGGQLAVQHAPPVDNVFPSVQVDDQGRTLGLEDSSDPALRDDPSTAIHTTLLPTVVPTTTVTDAALISTVTNLTNGAQTSIPLFPPPSSTTTTTVDVNQYGFVDPRSYSGTSFDLVGNGLHEPLNIIVSSLSNPLILTRSGFQSYCRSLDFDKECLGLHAGGFQKAFIDPRGWRDQEFIYRQVYTPLDHVFGTCIESLVGGNHIRAWQQQASGAWFLAVSKEMQASKNHMIVPDGYNLGRNLVVQKAAGKGKDGMTSFMGKRYRTEVVFVAGLMPQGVQGVNHDIAVDGLTAVLTVTVEDAGWFASKQAEGKQRIPVVASGFAAAKPEGAAAKGTDEDQKIEGRPRRYSLARRFSLSRATARQSEEQLEKRSPQHVWQRLRRTSAPKHPPTTAGAGIEPLVAVKEAEPQPESVESASTAAAAADSSVAQKAALVDATEPQPSGLVAA